jgi:hypothetical protein
MRDKAPLSPHFPVTAQDLAGYAQVFSNAHTFSKYVMHLRTGSRMAGTRPPPRDFAATLVRGLQRWYVPKQRVALSGRQVSSVVAWCIDKGHVDLARLLTISRHYLLRVESEAFPLQANGRRGLLPTDSNWHSQISLYDDCAEIRLRRRKADPQGLLLLRRCVCQTQSPLLCGVCSLKAAIASQQAENAHPSLPLFHRLEPRSALRVFQQAAALCSAPTPTWHSLRRGMAGDLLRAGVTLAEVLRAGGWRSAAFLKYIQRRDIDARADAELHLPSDDDL